jgi:hypothetical protein
MTIDEAIEQLEKLPSWYEEDFDSEDNAAIRLGIEALQRLKEQRDTGEVTFKPLPSEDMK